MIERTCVVCGKIFYEKSMSRLKESGGKYCSGVCYHRKQRMHYKKDLEPKKIIHMYVEERLSSVRIAKEFGCDYKRIVKILKDNGIHLRDIVKKLIERRCVVCGKIFYVQPYRVRNRGANCCSPECFHTSRRGKPTPMKGRRHSTETRMKISKSKKGQIPWMLGRHHTPETIKRVSEAKKGKPAWNKGKHHSPESIQKIKEAKSHISDETRRRISESKKIESQTPEVRERLRNQRLKQKFPFKDAKTTEVPIQNELTHRGIPFTPHLLIMGKNNRLVRAVDIAFPKHKLVVECDGDYWHGNPLKHKTFNKWQIKRIEMDKQQDERIREMGWQVLRFWESDIKKDVKGCVDKIEEALKAKR